jgi:amphi-Trp domain-containing protein
MGDKKDKKKDKRKDGREVQFEGSIDRERLAAYLRELADCVSEGAFSVESGCESMRLVLDDAMAMKLRASTDDEEQSLRLSLSWELRPAAQPKAEGLRFVRGDGAGEEASPPGLGSNAGADRSNSKPSASA